MINDTIYNLEGSSLDFIFTNARLSQPNLMDHSFTKIIVNKLPKVNLTAQKVSAKKGLSFDLIGAIIGLLMAYLFIDKSSLFSSFVGLIPESLVISPLLIMGVVGAVGLSSFVAWWAVEDGALS